MTSSPISTAADESTAVQTGQAAPFDYDVWQLVQDLYHAKQEMDIAERQFDAVIDPMLVDHAIFRLGAAEKRFNYLLQTARLMHVHLDGLRWDLTQSR